MCESPSIVPDTLGRDVYLVLEDFGSKLGLAWPETDVDHTDRVIRHLFGGMNEQICSKRIKAERDARINRLYNKYCYGRQINAGHQQGVQGRL